MSDAGSEPQRSKDVKDVHLVLLLHGLYGSPANLWCLEEEIRKAHYGDDTEDEEKRTAKDAPELDLVVLNAKSYSAAMTWDGIDVNAHRVSEELDAEIERIEADGRSVTAISITGYSLGGLIARALVGQLHARTPSFFDKHRPAAFATIATPHLGVLRYGSWRSTWLHAIGQRLFSRTGQQIYCLDTDRGIPLLAVMAHPDRIYYQALSLFPQISIIANGINDLTVPYPTAAIASHDPFVDYEIARDTGKPHVHLEMDGYVVCKWHIPDPEDDEVEDLIDLDSDDTTSKTPLPANAVAVVPRPWFPPVMYLDRPGIFRYALFPLLPFVIPMLLSFIALTFAYHSFQSSQRIRLHHSSSRRPLLIDDNGGYGATADSTPAETPMASGAGTPNGGGTPQLGPPLTPGTYSQPVLTPLQQSMITHLSTLPLERIVAWFPEAFNAHAVIIARNARTPRWSWQGQGRQVVRQWAARVVAAADLTRESENIDI